MYIYTNILDIILIFILFINTVSINAVYFVFEAVDSFHSAKGKERTIGRVDDTGVGIRAPQDPIAPRRRINSCLQHRNVFRLQDGQPHFSAN